jgi:hypothetical protein
VDQPRRRLDPLALTVLSAALAAIVGIAAFLIYRVRSDALPAQPPATADEHLREAIAEVRKWIEQPPAVAPPAPKPLTPVLYRPDPGHTWRYKVVVEPELWREATLTYHTVLQGDALGVTTQFRHAGGQMDFNLGVFAPAHPSHANVRFPGFFFHPAYFDRPLEVGQRFTWEWPWQLPGGQVRGGRLKRYTGELTGWNDIAIAGGRYPAARIEATLSYIDDGRLHASAKETIWYMPAVRQVAKVVREGATPDEGATRITAELVDFR